ncbi:MAG TPA: hypothetical protein DCQ20_03715, partial [Nitrospira sp.]|nr:hypothetical protein [Nitrospira sp.]
VYAYKYYQQIYFFFFKQKTAYEEPYLCDNETAARYVSLWRVLPAKELLITCLELKYSCLEKFFRAGEVDPHKGDS